VIVAAGQRLQFSVGQSKNDSRSRIGDPAYRDRIDGAAFQLLQAPGQTYSTRLAGSGANLN